MKSVIAATLVFVFGWGTSIASAENILRVDFGALDQTVDTDAGWEAFSISSTVTSVEATNTYSGIAVELDGQLDGQTSGYMTSRNRESVTFAADLDKMLQDTIFFKKDGTLTISNLIADTTYELTTYHHDSHATQPSSFDVLLITGGSSTSVATGVLAGTGTTPSSIASVNFLATSDASGSIEIMFDKTEIPPEPGTDWTSLSGLNIAAVPEPSTLGLTAAGLLGLVLCGLRRKR